MNWLVKIKYENGSVRHKLYKTERGARNLIDKKLSKDDSVTSVELYEQVSVSFKQTDIFNSMYLPY